MIQEFEFVGSSRSCSVDELHAHTAIYTSAHVVRAMLSRTGWPSCEGDLIDPSAGDGSFLVEALAMLNLPPQELVSTNRVFGMEIHPGAVADGRERLTSFFIERGCAPNEARSAAERMLVEGDFLADPLPARRFARCVGNPPYLRFANLPQFFKELYTAHVPKMAIGDLQHAFLDRCRTIVGSQGSMCFVTADRWLFNNSAADLREDLGRDFGISHMGRLDPSTSFYRPKVRRRGSPPRIHPVEIHLCRGPGRFQLSRSPICPDGDHPDDHSEKQLIDIASVRIAPWLGPFGLWVVDAEFARSHPEADWIPAVDTDDITAENLLKNPTRFALKTCAELMPGSPSIAQYLWERRHLMPKREESRPWWMPPESITLPLDRPFLLIPRIAKRVRVIEVPAGILPINHNLSVVAAAGGPPLSTLKDILQSERTQQFIQRHAPRLENGFLSITTTLLRRIPVN